jgi:glycosyltransferase involved in cell wall biosynthesis
MISVIIPVYNRAKYIADCLESVFNQTCKDFEVLVVNDGSTDNTEEVLSPYMNRIRYISKQNGGAASARNVGIENARGEYVAFLDSDDQWFDFKLELELEVLSKLPHVGFVHSDFSLFSDVRNLVSSSYMREYFHILEEYDLAFEHIYPYKAKLEDLNIRGDSAFKDALLFWGDISDKLIFGPMYLTSSTLIRKKCIDAIGLFDLKYKTAEDFDFFARLGKKYEVAYLTVATLRYRRYHPGQLSSYEMQIDTNNAWLDIATRLWMHDQSFYSTHKKLVDWRLSHYMYASGRTYLSRKKYHKAFENFRNSLKINPLQKGAYLFAALAFVLKLTGHRNNYE